MNAFQVILTIALLAVGLYSIALRRKISMLGNVAVGVTMIAMVLVWRPALATTFAGWLGIGRGADLIFYCWVVISMVMILNLHLKIRIQAETMTELVRQLAIAQPLAVPDQNAADSGGRAEHGGRAETVQRTSAELVEFAGARHADRPNLDGR